MILPELCRLVNPYLKISCKITFSSCACRKSPSGFSDSFLQSAARISSESEIQSSIFRKRKIPAVSLFLLSPRKPFAFTVSPHAFGIQLAHLQPGMYSVKGGFSHLQRNDWRLICGRMATGGKGRYKQRVAGRPAPVKAKMNGLAPGLDRRRPPCW